MNKQEEMAALAILIHDLRKHKKYTLKELADKIVIQLHIERQIEPDRSTADIGRVGPDAGLIAQRFVVF